MLNIVLVNPNNNTGNIGRLCVGESRLHLVHPFCNQKNQNVPLDYWIHLDVTEYQNADEWIAQIQDTPVFS
jgi:tRNA (cytidine/uridine-2'-O-)-methyltransferase